MEEAQEQLGRPVIIDDLKVVEGIGPQVEEVLQSAGITDWAALANSTPQSLRDVLSGAGPQFNAHDPTTWPQQAVLAIGGHWDALRQLAGRAPGRPRPSRADASARSHAGRVDRRLAGGTGGLDLGGGEAATPEGQQEQVADQRRST